MIIISKKKLHKWLSVHFLHFNEDDVDDEKEDESLPATRRNETIEGRQPAWEDDADEEERWMEHAEISHKFDWIFFSLNMKKQLVVKNILPDY